jgi:molybdate transport system substrate-binding protein
MTPSAEIEVLSSLATRGAYLELVPQFECASGRKVETTWAEAVDIIKRISAGESFDLIIAANSTIDDFILLGGSKPAAGSISLAPVSDMQRGAQRPDIGSAEPLKRVLLAAKSVGYSTGPSGAYLAALFESKGIGGDIRRSRAKYRSAQSSGRSSPEIGFQHMSELLHVDGINVIGPLPAEMQHTTDISCEIAVAPEEPDGARALVEFLAAPTARDAFERAGLQAG